jgi:hypothetical protein
MEGHARNRRDVFNANLIYGAILCGQYGFPPLGKSLSVPKAGSLVSFPKRRRAPRSSWVHFYTDDYRFAGLWRNPHRYLEELRSFAGVITPDFSV